MATSSRWERDIGDDNRDAKISLAKQIGIHIGFACQSTATKYAAVEPTSRSSVGARPASCESSAVMPDQQHYFHLL
eukprot:4570144-Amphidinium_carterae.1